MDDGLRPESSGTKSPKISEFSEIFGDFVPLLSGLGPSSKNGPLSHNLSSVLNCLADEMDKTVKSECKNTEEMVAGIEEINEKERDNRTVIWSSDVKALYPSLRVNDVSKIIYEEYINADLEVNTDDDELGLYIALTHDMNMIKELGLEKVTAKRKKEGARGARPGITTHEVLGGTKAKDKSLFRKPEESPSKHERKIMTALAIKTGVEAVMKNHLYKFNGDVYLQSDGGPIGLELTGAISRVVMSHWDKKLMTKLKNAGSDIKWHPMLYMRYVDDSNYIGQEIPPGARLGENGKIKIMEEFIEQDKEIQGDLRTAKMVQKIANNIYDFIQVEIDCPSLHDSGYMPILDLSVKVEENYVIYEYYRKEMVNFKVLMANSAMPYSMRKTSLVQEVVRILRNTSRRVKKERRTFYLNEFSLRLKVSGYGEKFRRSVIKEGMEAFDKQIEREQRGERPLYRPKGYEEEDRRRKKKRNKNAWYKPSDTVLFVPPTPNGQLKRKLQEIADHVGREKLKVKIVERAGRKLRAILPGIKENTDCRRKDCIIHSMGGKGNCNLEGAVYKGECKICHAVYIGETSRSTYIRGKEHLSAMDNPRLHKNNAFAKHILEEHGGSKPGFEVQIIKAYRKPLERQVREGVEILGIKDTESMNSKIDHIQPALRRVGFLGLLDDEEP